MDEQDVKNTEENTEKKKFSFGRKLGDGIKGQTEALAYGGKALFFTMILTFLVTIVACIAVFFANLQGAEQVMVPDVVGKTLTNALLEMQQKELYPKIQLRYSDEEGDAMTILEQDPDPGAIVKAYRRVTLTVSRGIEGNVIDDLLGKNIEDVLPELQKKYEDPDSMVTVAAPVYKKDSSVKGTILAQNPPAKTAVSDRTKLQLIVSKGMEEETAKVPDLSGMKVKDALNAISSSNVIFDFTSHEAFSEEKPGTVVSQEEAGSTVSKWSHIKADFAFAAAKEEDENTSGIFNAEINEYPYPVAMTVIASSQEGKSSTLASFYHNGGKVSLPYTVAKGSTLTLYALDKEVYSAVAN